MKLLINNSEEEFENILNLDKNICTTIIRIAINKLNFSKEDIAKKLHKSSRTIDNWLKVHNDLSNIEIIPIKPTTKDDSYIKLAIKDFGSIYREVIGLNKPVTTYILSYSEINPATDMNQLLKNTMKSGYTINQTHTLYPQFSESTLGRIKQDSPHEIIQHKNTIEYINSTLHRYKPIAIKTLLPLKFDWNHFQLKKILNQFKHNFSLETLEHIFNNLWIIHEAHNNKATIYYEFLDIMWSHLSNEDRNILCNEVYKSNKENYLITEKGLYELYNNLFKGDYKDLEPNHTLKTKAFVQGVLKDRKNLHVKIKELNTKKSNLGESYLYYTVSERHSKYKEKSIIELLSKVIQKNNNYLKFRAYYNNDTQSKLPFLSKYEIQKLVKIDNSKQFNISYLTKRKMFQVKNVHELKFSIWKPSK
jgi:hypothetical protein